jgi:acyl carrier protein
VLQRAPAADVVYEVLATRWPGRFGDDELGYHVSLGSEGLGLDSIEIVELVLECEERFGRSGGAEGLLEAGPVTLGAVIEHLSQA